MNNQNGSDSGNGGDGENKAGRILQFPSLAERDRQRRQYRDQPIRGNVDTTAATRKQPFLKIGNIPPFTRTLIASFLIMHIPLFVFLGSDAQLLAFYRFGFIPGSYTGTYEWHWTALISPLSHALIHGSWMHLLFNSVMGLALGIFFERIYGARTALVFFVLCTLAGALIYFISAPASIVPVIGASGGISGLFGAALLLLSQQQGNIRLPGKLTRHGPWPILIIWGLLIVLPGLLMGGTLAWQAHLGGYIAGIALLILMQKRKIRL